MRRRTNTIATAAVPPIAAPAIAPITMMGKPAAPSSTTVNVSTAVLQACSWELYASRCAVNVKMYPRSQGSEANRT